MNVKKELHACMSACNLQNILYYIIIEREIINKIVTILSVQNIYYKSAAFIHFVSHLSVYPHNYSYTVMY